MSIKPIDFQIMMPKIHEVAKLSNDQNQRNLVVQQSQENSNNNIAENRINKVSSNEKGHEVSMKDDPQKKKQQQKDKKDGKKSNQDNKNTLNKTGNNIDIRL